MLHGPDDQRVGHDANHNGRDAVQQIDYVAKDKRKGFAAVLSQKNAGQKADRNADHRGHQQNLAASDNGVGHAAAGFAGRLGQLGEEIPIQRLRAVVQQVAQE